MSVNVAIPFSSALARVQKSRTTPQERRRFRRLRLVLGGRLMDAQGRESVCRTEDVSPGDARIASPAIVERNARVVLYLDEIGRIAGQVARVSGGSEFALVFDASVHKKEKLAERLTWLICREPLGLREEAAPPRIEGRGQVEIIVDGGATILGEAVDFSLAGITVRTAQQPPPIGAWVRVGGIHGRVARLIADGFAVDFASLSPQPADSG
jgi:hypothetical protein